MSTISDVDKYYTSARIYSAIESTFAHWDDVPDMVHDTVFKAYVDAISVSANRMDFFRETQRYLAQFRNAHTEFVDTTFSARGDITFGLTARRIDGLWTVASSFHESIHTGDVIERIEDQNANEFLEHYVQLVSASKPEYRDYVLWRRPFFLPDELRIGLSSGVTARITKGAIPERPRPAVEFSGIAGTPLITIHSFDEPEFEDKAIAYINEHREAPALVIDIRGNGGGNTPEKLTNTLMNTPYPTWREASAFRLGVDVAIEQLHSSRPVRSDERPRFTLSWTSSLVQPEGNCYQGKIFILHDIGTKSAAEDFLMPFKATGRATLIGETTCGSSGQPYIDHPFVDATFAIGAKRQLFPNGDRFEGIGIVPDVYVSSDRSHLHAGVDGVLQELEKIL